MTTTEAGVEAPAPSPHDVKIRDGGCAGCTLCCKVLGVPTLGKPPNKWCDHCKMGFGCGIYETRPPECGNFICGFLSMPDLPEVWRPAFSKLVLFTQNADRSLTVFVDPARPDAWRREPYYSVLKRWARQALRDRRRVLVRVADKSIVILPDHAIDLGVVADDEVIVVVATTPDGGKTIVHHTYAAKADAWAKTGFEVMQGLRVPLLSDGYRPGRRLE